MRIAAPLRVAVSLFALGGGAFCLREFILTSEAVCEVARPEMRQRIMQGLRIAVREQRFLLAFTFD